MCTVQCTCVQCTVPLSDPRAHHSDHTVAIEHQAQRDAHAAVQQQEVVLRVCLEIHRVLGKELVSRQDTCRFFSLDCSYHASKRTIEKHAFDFDTNLYFTKITNTFHIFMA